MKIHIVIPFEVQPKQADRSRIAKTRDGRQFIAHYQPAEVRDFSRNLAALLAPHRPPAPMEGPLQMDVRYLFTWTTSAPKRQRSCGWWPKDTKPDFDNCCKSVLDVLEKAGFFLNDSQIWDARVRKIFSDQPAIELTLWQTETIVAADGRTVTIKAPPRGAKADFGGQLLLA